MPPALASPPRPLLAFNPAHHEHDGRMNENAGRVVAVVAELKRSGLWDRCEILEDVPPGDGAVEAVHSARHLTALRTAFASAQGWFAVCARCRTLTPPRSALRVAVRVLLLVPVGPPAALVAAIRRRPIS